MDSTRPTLCERSRSNSSSQLMILRNVCNYDIQGEGSPSIVSTVERTKTNRRRKVKKSRD
ncbi:hypothetical protein YC2023_029134 [Brassica napus]